MNVRRARPARPEFQESWKLARYEGSVARHGHELQAGRFDRRQGVEGGTALSPIQEIGWRTRKTLSGSVGVMLPDRHDPFSRGKGKRGVQRTASTNAEHGCRGAIPMASSEDHDGGKASISSRHPKPVARVLTKCSRTAPVRGLVLVLHLLKSSELDMDARRAACSGSPHQFLSSASRLT